MTSFCLFLKQIMNIWLIAHDKLILCVFQVYWVGPCLGGILAAVFHEYLFCPDPDLKKRNSDAFIKRPFSGTKLRQDSVTTQEPLFTVMDMEQVKTESDMERSEEVLSSFSP